jgi:uncharacterized Zn finger protein
MNWGWGAFGDYVSVAEKRRRAEAAARKLEKKGRPLAPVRLTGRAIASTFWGKAWCQNLESYSDYDSRLPRGRSYARNGSVIDLQIRRGIVAAMVSGTSVYNIEIKIDALDKTVWDKLKRECAGKVGSLMDLLRGKLSGPVMEVITRKDGGLFPKPKEIHLDCSCPDWADMCKHVAATLYGVGARLDESPELLFALRGVDHLELIAETTQNLAADLAAPADGADTLDAGSLSEVFGIELESATLVTKPVSKSAKPRARPAARQVAAKSPRAKSSAPVQKKRPVGKPAHTAKALKKEVKSHAAATLRQPAGKKPTKMKSKAVLDAKKKVIPGTPSNQSGRRKKPRHDQ